MLNIELNTISVKDHNIRNSLLKQLYQKVSNIRRMDNLGILTLVVKIGFEFFVK